MFESTPFYEYATITFGQLFFYFLYISPVVILISYIICNKLKTKKILSEDNIKKEEYSNKLEFSRVVLGFGLIIFLGCLLIFLLVFLKNTNETSFEKLEFAHTLSRFETLSQSKHKYILDFEKELFANYIKIENRLIIFEKKFVDSKHYIKLEDNIDFLLLLFSKLNSSEKEAILDSLYKYVSDGLFQEFEFYLIQHKINSYYTRILKEKLDKERIYNDFKKSDN